MISLVALFAHGGGNADCTLNGQPIDCGELLDKAEPFIGLGLGLLALVSIVLIAVFVFWLLMLIHAIQHDSPDRTIWIVVLLVAFVTGFALIGAIVYFFAEKKRAEAVATGQATQPVSPPAPPLDSATAQKQPSPKNPAQK